MTLKTRGRRTTTLIVLPLFALLGTAPAQAAEIDIWGVGHVSVDAVDDDVDTFTNVASNSSRLAISGNQSVTDSIEVVFQYESGVDVTGQGYNDGNGGADSGGQFFTRTRDAFVGIKGSLGTLTFGRVGGLNQWVYDYNLFADQVGDLGNIWGGTGLAGRIDNTVQYISPEMGFFTGKVVYAPDEGVDGTDLAVLKGDFQVTDGLKFGVAYMNQGMGTGPGVEDHTAFAVTGSFSVGNFSIGGGYQNESDIDGISGNDSDSFTIGGTMSLGGKGMLKAQFTQFNGDAEDSDANQIALGYDYSIADNMTIYAAYARTSNDPNVAFTSNNYGHGDAITPLPGNDPSVFSIGFVYKFRVNILK